MIDDYFQILHVNVPNEERLDEPLGSKTKFWFEGASEKSGTISKQLWKLARADTFEDISEKLAAELGYLLGIPVARVELAECEGTRGSFTTSFLAKGDRLVHGNEILYLFDPSYPRSATYSDAQKHTVEAVLDALDRLNVAPWADWDASGIGTSRASDLFVGYLLFDAWIGNTDRHHENWGVVQRGSARYLAPSYDHASSLGRIEPLNRIQLRLKGNDPRCTVAGYARGARSAFYAPNGAKTHPVEAFIQAERMRPVTAAYWRRKLDSIDTDAIEKLIERVPSVLWSTSHVTFVKRLVDVNLERIQSTHV